MGKTKKPENRALPSDVSAERAFLGGLITDSDKIDENPISPSDFYAPHHSALYSVLRSMARTGEPIDMITVPGKIGNHQDKFGGLAYVMELPDHCPSSASLPAYAAIIRAKAVRRRALAAIDTFKDELMDSDEDESVIIARVIASLEASTATAGKENWSRLGDSSDQIMADVKQRIEQGGAIGFPTGLDSLDDCIGGLQPSKFYVLAARPSFGKTSLALQMADSVASYGFYTGIFSLEMATKELGERWVVSKSGIDSEKVKNGNLTPEMLRRIELEANDLRALSIYVDDRVNVGIDDIIAQSRLLAKTAESEGSALGALFLDYIQLMNLEIVKGSTSTEALGKVSRGCKVLAKSLKVPVVAISQLNRDLERRQDPRPKLSDIRGSGSIEQDADTIIFIHKPSYYKKDDKPGISEIIVAKQRNGSTNTIDAKWVGHLTRFEDLDDD